MGPEETDHDRQPTGPRRGPPAPLPLDVLKDLERKVLWLATHTIHHANHERHTSDPLKVGGHQASSASLVSIMTALYFAVLRPEDRVAVKPHASPVFHAIQYLLGNQDVDQLKRFRAFGGAQSYPSRTKDADDVDFSTGSVGLGVAMTSFASLVQDYIHAKGWGTQWPMGRMVALVGDAELDEGNIYEALLEGFKHGLRNTWWIIDYNRQSLDAVLSHLMTPKLESLFDNMGWKSSRSNTARSSRPCAARRAASASFSGSTVATTRSIRRSPSRADGAGNSSMT
jgi:pyruvate dehydrogenase E1 component